MLADTIVAVSSGVAHLVLERDRRRLGSGSGYLFGSYLATASHVIRTGDWDALTFAFDDGAVSIRLLRDEVLARLEVESDWTEHDIALLSFEEPELRGRHRFEATAVAPRTGEQALLLGYPFESPHMAAHVAYISSVHQSGASDVLQLDGSANPSNSGGPVIDPESRMLIGWVVRAQTGLERDFDDLIVQLRSNVEQLSRPQGARITVGGVDPVVSLRATMIALMKIATNMKRSSNVGIAYATAARHLVDLVQAYEQSE